MKKRIVLMAVCVVLLIVTVANHLYDKSREDDRALLHCVWLTVQEPYTIRLHFLDDADGILPIDKPSYFMSVYDWGRGLNHYLRAMICGKGHGYTMAPGR